MRIIDVLQQGGEGAVLADENSGIVRLWVLTGSFKDGRTMRALRRFFPGAEIRGTYGEFIRLGGYRSLAEAHHWVAEAKMTSYSVPVQRLVRFDVPESLATIKHYS